MSLRSITYYELLPWPVHACPTILCQIRNLESYLTLAMLLIYTVDRQGIFTPILVQMTAVAFLRETQFTQGYYYPSPTHCLPSPSNPSIGTLQSNPSVRAARAANNGFIQIHAVARLHPRLWFVSGLLVGTPLRWSAKKVAFFLFFLPCLSLPYHALHRILRVSHLSESTHGVGG